MTSSEYRPKPLKLAEVRAVVIEAIRRGTYHDTRHIRFDHPEREIWVQDVIAALKQSWSGCSVDGFSGEHWQWKYKIRTVDIEEETLFVVVALDPKNIRFDIITGFYDRS